MPRYFFAIVGGGSWPIASASIWPIRGCAGPACDRVLAGDPAEERRLAADAQSWRVAVRDRTGCERFSLEYRSGGAPSSAAARSRLQGRAPSRAPALSSAVAGI